MAMKLAETQPSEAGETVEKMQTYWKRELERAHKHFNEKFWPRADKLYKKYAKQAEQDDGKRRFAMLWANTEVLKPSVYARPPIPQVSRRYRDKDPVGRLAAELLERAASFEFERMNIDSVLRSVRDDLLIPGRGQAWVRYEAEDDGEKVTDHRVVVEYLHYRQFMHGPARRWEEVPWVSKITYMDNDEGKKRFKDKWTGVQLDNKPDSDVGDAIRDPALENAQEAKATIYEIWSKKHKKVFFIAKNCSHVLEESEPLLDLKNFFPCPKPVYATVTNNSLIPTPDYTYYQDQAEEIDKLTDRIDSLTTNLKLVGFYPAGAEGDVTPAIEKALSPATQNAMIPIASWAAFGERGGSNAIVWLPIKEVVETVRACVELRNQIIQDTYQITGISDILRGQTESDETATAQSIKAQWGSVRIQDRQAELVRFAKDLTEMACEIIAEQFDPEVILQMANMPRPEQPQQPPPPDPSLMPEPTGDPEQDAAMQQQMEQMLEQAQQEMAAWEQENAKFDEAFALLMNDRLRGFRIDIETDSTIQPDEDAEKERRTEFVTAIGGIIQQAVPLILQVPEMAGLISETLLFVARGFRAGRQLEDQIEQSMNAIQERIAQQMQQQPEQDPTIAAKAQAMEQETAHKGQMNELEVSHRAQMNQLEIQKMMDKANAEIEVKQRTADTDMQLMGQKGELELNHGKAKLKDQIIQEDGEAFLGQPTEQINGVAQVIQQMMEGFMMALQQSNMTVIQSNQQLVQALTAPKTITAPDGRTYTATVN